MKEELLVPLGGRNRTGFPQCRAFSSRTWRCSTNQRSVGPTHCPCPQPQHRRPLSAGMVLWALALVVNSKQRRGQDHSQTSETRKTPAALPADGHRTQTLGGFSFQREEQILSISLEDAFPPLAGRDWGLAGGLGLWSKEPGELLFLMCTWLFMHGLSSSSWANFSLPGFQEKGLSSVITLLIHHSRRGGTACAGG